MPKQQATTKLMSKNAMPTFLAFPPDGEYELFILRERSEEKVKVVNDDEAERDELVNAPLDVVVASASACANRNGTCNSNSSGAS